MPVPGESIMFARNVTLHLKANGSSEFTQALETEVLPMLRKQEGFQDEIDFVSEDRGEAVSISIWDRKEHADAYGRDTYPAVLKSLDNVVNGDAESGDLRSVQLDLPQDRGEQLRARPGFLGSRWCAVREGAALSVARPSERACVCKGLNAIDVAAAWATASGSPIGCLLRRRPG